MKYLKNKETENKIEKMCKQEPKLKRGKIEKVIKKYFQKICVKNGNDFNRA